MDFNRLRSVLAAFADDNADFIMDKSGTIAVQINGEVITATTSMQRGQLFVTENGDTVPAGEWVADRIAQLKLLAERIASVFAKKEHEEFITPRGELLDLVENSPRDEAQLVDDSLATAEQVLAARPGGVCSVLYLTSGAGEGKTTLIRQLALRQAKAYREGRADWLLVPFSLGGNAFLRLDTVIAAGLLNQLRIRRFYIDGFLHLVRLGYIVPALDGFEEVFVETSGEAVSSLGNLIRDMNGEGTLLVAARTAYFEFKRMDRQARLFDSIPGIEASFGRLSLSLWGEKEFLTYCRARSVNDGEQLYLDLAGRLGHDHAFLTRAFFVSRIVDFAQGAGGKEFLDQLQPEIQDSFRPFVDRILEREVNEKWLDKYGQPAIPLLTIEEHHELLRLVAEEMWTAKRGSLPGSTCQDLADIYCEQRRKSPMVTRQVQERLWNHALLAADSSKAEITFDHDHFKDFFLGEVLGQHLQSKATADIRKLLRVDSVPGTTLDSAITFALERGSIPADLITIVLQVAAQEGPTSFVRENAGGLCLLLAEKLPQVSGAPQKVSEISFPPDGFGTNLRYLRSLEFRRCYFRPTAVRAQMSSVVFEQCEFEHIEVDDEYMFNGTTFLDCRIHGLTVTRGDQSTDIFDPARIDAYLMTSGSDVTHAEQAMLIVPEPLPDEDDRTRIVRKLMTVFKRQTHLSESVAKLRLGAYAGTFFAEMFDELFEAGVIKSVKNRGGGSDLRLKLGRSMASIATALSAASGSYPEFLARVREQNDSSGSELNAVEEG